MEGFSRVQRTEVDGVRTVWVPGRSATLRATLAFRVGMVDASLVEFGWIHLLEHMALHGQSRPGRLINGSTSLLITTFDVAAEPDDVGEFLAGVCGWLSAPDLHDLDRETRVLRAESGQRSIPTSGRHLLWRYGVSGPGLAAQQELGLYRLDPDALRRLAARVFVRENAMLALTGQPPASLRLPLPEGPRLPAPRAVRCDQPYPSVFEDRVGGIGLSGEVPRSAAATLLGRTVQRTLDQSIRQRSGSGYHAWSVYEPVDADTAVVFAGTDVLEDARGGLVVETVKSVRQLAEQGGDAAELAGEVSTMLRLMGDDPDGAWQPWSCIRAELVDGKPFDVEAFVDEIRSVDTAAVARAARAFADSMIVGVDPGTAPGYLPVLSVPVAATAPDGRRFTHLDAPLTPATLVIGDGIAACTGHDGYMTARFDDLAAVLAYPDGGRTLIRSDGYQLRVEPTVWRSGPDAVRSLDAAVDPALVVPMPERAAADIPRPSVTSQHRREHWLRKHKETLLAVGALILAIVAVVIAVLTANPRYAFAVIVWLAIGIGATTRRRH